MLQIVQDRARRADRRRHFRAAKAVERLHFEVLAQRQMRVVVEKGEAVARDERARELAESRGLFLGHEQLGRLHARDLVGQLLFIRELREAEIARGEIDECKAVAGFCARADRREEVVPLRIQHLDVRDGARRNDVRDFALHDLPFLRLADLIANRHALPGLDQPANVIVRRVVRDAAHRHEISLRQRDVEKARRLLRVLEKHFVKIAEPEQQQRIRRQRAPDALVLLHHRGQRVGHWES